MNGTSNNIDVETQRYQEETSRVRFKQNLIQGIGAATVFGLATGLFQHLIRVATTGSTVAAGLSMGWAWVGIAAAVVIGFGCLYVASRLHSELVRIEQDHHAKQIAKGINRKAPELTQQKPVSFPSQDKTIEASVATTLQNAANQEQLNPAQPTVSDVRLEDKVALLDETRKARV